VDYKIESICVFCKLVVRTRKHHIIPKSKKGSETTSTCETCENFIHGTWSNNELRDTYNTTEIILKDPKFQKFLKWRRKQQVTTVFKTKQKPKKRRN